MTSEHFSRSVVSRNSNVSGPQSFALFPTYRNRCFGSVRRNSLWFIGSQSKNTQYGKVSLCWTNSWAVTPTRRHVHDRIDRLAQGWGP